MLFAEPFYQHPNDGFVVTGIVVGTFALWMLINAVRAIRMGRDPEARQR